MSEKTDYKALRQAAIDAGLDPGDYPALRRESPAESSQRGRGEVDEAFVEKWAVKLNTWPEFIRGLLADLAATARPAPSEAPRWRPEVVAFADAMEAKLRANDHKPGWKREDPGYLLERLREETDELLVEVCAHARDRARILAEAADVANMAMMVSDVCGALNAPSEAPRPLTKEAGDE